VVAEIREVISATVWGQAYKFQFSRGSRFPSGKSWDREN